jgi:hypothetical protein
MMQVTGSKEKDCCFIDETFDLTRSKTYELLCKVNYNCISLSILDPVQNKHIVFKEFNFPKLSPELLLEEIEKKLSSDEIWKLKYKKVKISNISPKGILIPKPFFDEKLLKDYLSTSYYLDDMDLIRYNKIKDNSFYSVFPINGRLYEFIMRQHPEVKFFNQITSLINYLGKNHSSSVLLNKEKTILDIIIYKDGSIESYSSFIIESLEDVLYFTLFSLTNNDLPTDKTQITITGDINDSELLKIKEQIPNVKFEKFKHPNSFSYTFKIDYPEYINLFTLIDCE